MGFCATCKCLMITRRENHSQMAVQMMCSPKDNFLKITYITYCYFSDYNLLN